MTTPQRRSTATAGRTAMAFLLGGALLLTSAACTSAGEESAAAQSSSNSSAADSAAPSTSGGPGEATQIPAEVSAPPTVPSDGAPASAAGPATDPTTTAPPVSTAGPVPSTGDINQEVPAVELTTNAPVPLDGTADFGGSVSATLTEVSAVDATARIPGEISGPALAVTVQIQNSSADPIGLDNVTVNLDTKDGTPASPITTEPAAPLSGVLLPGETRSGVYVFTLPAESRAGVGITVLYSTGAPIVLFQGDAP
jgi:hypothetical protein